MGLELSGESNYEDLSGEALKKTDFPSIVKNDFRMLNERHRLETTKDVEELLFQQTIEGHAQSGHCCFREHKLEFLNVTLDDIVRIGLELNVAKIKSRRQDVIDDIYRWVDRAIAKKNVKGLVNKNGEPLAGHLIFNEVDVVNPYNVLRGVLLGSKMDNYSWRQKVSEKYGLEMGGGQCVAVDMEALRRTGYTLYDLTKMRIIKKGYSIEEFLNASGCIIKDYPVRTNMNIRNGYVRLKEGRGVSDDAAAITSGLFFSEKPFHKITLQDAIEVFSGLILVDAIDTFDKYTHKIVENGQDEALGEHVESRINLGLSKEDIVNFIYLSAIKPEVESEYPDSSQRYFAQINCEHKNQKVTGLRSHIHFIQHFISEIEKGVVMDMKYPRIKLGFKEVPNTSFYEQLRKVFYKAEDNGIIRLN